MLPSDFNSRPRSEVLNRGNHASGDSEKVNGWREDLQHYERNLEEMTSVNLDQNFKEELQHVDQWFRYLSETERTATIYTLLQHSSQVQVRFFISILQQLMKRDPLHSYLTPANPDQDMQSQLAGAVAKMELETGQRGRTGATIRRPPSTGSERHVVDNRHSFALGDTEDYSRLFGPMGSNSNSMLNLNGSMMDDFGRAPISRASNRNSLFASAANQRSRPRSVIEGDSSLLFPSGNTSTWLQPPHHNTSTTLGGRLGMAAERPKSADVSMWTLPSRDPIDDKKRAGWGVPSTVQFADLSPRDDWSRRAGRNIPGTVPETDERTNSNSPATSSSSINPALDSANLVLSYDSRSPPVPSVSASAPFTRRHHLAPPGMEKHYGQFLNPGDAGGPGDDHDYLSDHSEASNLSTDRGYKRRVAPGKSPAQSAGSRTPKEGTSNKKAAETVNMDLLEDVPAWFRSLRLHKYNAIFEPMKWQDIVKMTDEDLQAKGVAALGARRKMLKVFETVRAHCDANNIEY
ncbi:hypothetical protein BJV82DRAFT_597193 [Fennellomyces sp. T-0311]|nr:hypothetical protein BJV82DRAFT_597193 [Fennellomyces sp. T-0311]